jgi:two-component system LytT family response regulator
MTDTALVRVLIADDEPIARAGLRELLRAVEWLTVIGEAASGPAALEAIDTLQPDLVFLDIQMPGMLGTDVMRTMRHQPLIIFTTAWSQHAPDAFELGALDYLLKPFGADRLQRTLERVRASLGESDAVAGADRWREMQRGGVISRLFVRVGRALVPVAIESVDWFEADGDYVAVHVGRTRHLVHIALARLEARLDPAKFVRIHRTSIVNLTRVVAFRPIANGRFEAELVDGTRLDVSRAKARELRTLAG